MSNCTSTTPLRERPTPLNNARGQLPHEGRSTYSSEVRDATTNYTRDLEKKQPREKCTKAVL